MHLAGKRRATERCARYALLIVCSLLVLVSSGCQKTESVEARSGQYLGQDPPGLQPEVFAPGLISHGFHELSPAFSPKGDEAFYVTSDRRGNYTIIHVTNDGDGWGEPEIASFSGRYPDASPCFSADGNKLHFCSRRPVSGGSAPEEDFDIWIVEKKDDSWSEPYNLGSPINDERDVRDVTVSENGTVYFSANRKNGSILDLYVSRIEDGKYTAPETIGGDISTDFNESGPHVAADERYLLFQSNRPGGFGGNDLYICFRQADGPWSEPVNLGATVNSASHDYRPRVTPDGKYLFFTSGRPADSGSMERTTYEELLKSYRHPQSGYGTLFWMEAGIIDEFRPEESM